MSAIIKVVFENNEIRRLPVSNLDFVDLVKSIRQLFKLSEQQAITIKYLYE
jgi:hypothetical protein